MATETADLPAIHLAARDAVNTPPSRDPRLMRRLYELVYKCRSIEAQTASSAKANSSSAGLEAVLAGVGAGLLPEDTLLAAESGPALQIAVGQSLSDVTGSKEPSALSGDRCRVLCAPPGGIRPLLAFSAGYASDRQADGKPGVTIALCPEASLASSREVLDFAANKKLPLVIVTEHNLASGKTGRTTSGRSRTERLPHMLVDGNDALVIYRVTQESLYRARHNGGPTVIECKTWRPVAGSRKGKTRPPKNLQRWIQPDALEYLERQMKARGFWSEEWREEFVAEWEGEMRAMQL